MMVPFRNVGKVAGSSRRFKGTENQTAGTEVIIVRMSRNVMLNPLIEQLTLGQRRDTAAAACNSTALSGLLDSKLS
jgi:hypothetical protein